MTHVLTPDFFNRPTPLAAQELIGKFMIREHNKHQWTLMITEVEAYDGPDDTASRAHKGRTKHTEPMFACAGTLHIHPASDTRHILHVVTGPENYPAAILIRSALIMLPTGELEHINDPGMLTSFLKIDSAFDAIEATKQNGLWFEDRDVVIPKEHIMQKKRISVDHTNDGNDLLYNFSIAISQNKPLDD